MRRVRRCASTSPQSARQTLPSPPTLRSTWAERGQCPATPLPWAATPTWRGRPGNCHSQPRERRGVFWSQETESGAWERPGQSGGLLLIHRHELRQPLEDHEQEKWCHVQETLIVIFSIIIRHLIRIKVKRKSERSSVYFPNQTCQLLGQPFFAITITRNTTETWRSRWLETPALFGVWRTL